MSKVAVYIEMKEGEVRKQVFEVLTFAHRGGSDVCGIVLEGDAEGCKGSLEEYGVSSIIQVKSNVLANYDPGVYADAAIAALKHSGADSLLALTSAQGKDLLPRIAAKLKLPLIMDATVVNVAESSVVKSHFSGRANAEISLSGDLKLFGVRPNSVDPEAKAASATVESIDADLSSDSRVGGYCGQPPSPGRAAVLHRWNYCRTKPVSLRPLRRSSPSTAKLLPTRTRHMDSL